MVLAEDGSVDTGVAKFVKWAIRFIGGVMLLQVLVSPNHCSGLRISVHPTRGFSSTILVNLHCRFCEDFRIAPSG